MKIRSLIMAVVTSMCILLLSNQLAYAANVHTHPSDVEASAKDATPKIAMPGYCEIEIVNHSFHNVSVHGDFDDGTSMYPFNVYSFGYAQYIDLYYYNYCHAGMYLSIYDDYGYVLYSAYTPVGSSIVISLFGKQLKAEVHAK